MSNQIPRGRKAAQEQADLLARQVVVGWGKTHPFVLEAEVLAAKIKASNDEYKQGK